jgi:hypothetical protein
MIGAAVNQRSDSMNQQKRQSRATARVKTMSLRRQGVPCNASKWGYDPLREIRKGDLTPGEVQSVRKLVRREGTPSHIDLGARNRNLVDLRDFETKAEACAFVTWVHAQFKAGRMNVPLAHRIRTVKTVFLTALGAKVRRVIVVAA